MLRIDTQNGNQDFETPFNGRESVRQRYSTIFGNWNIKKTHTPGEINTSFYGNFHKNTRILLRQNTQSKWIRTLYAKKNNY